MPETNDTPTPPDDATPPGDAEARKKLYASTHDELVAKQNSNSEKYDDAILKLSAAGLGLSLAFVKDVVPITQIADRMPLKASWLCFIGAIVVTLTSFQVSQKAIQTSLDYAEKYYLEGEEKYLTEPNRWASATNKLNLLSGLLFISAILLTAYFVITNLPPVTHENVQETTNNTGHPRHGCSAKDFCAVGGSSRRNDQLRSGCESDSSCGADSKEIPMKQDPASTAALANGQMVNRIQTLETRGAVINALTPLPSSVPVAVTPTPTQANPSNQTKVK